jgi:hypothetical protein
MLTFFPSVLSHMGGFICRPHPFHYGPFPPFWWLETSFGKFVFVLTFLTWGLVIIALVLGILSLVRKLFGENQK